MNRFYAHIPSLFSNAARSIGILAVLSCLFGSALAQNTLHYDHMDPKKSMFEVFYEGGQEKFRNAHGEVITPDPIYKKALKDRVEDRQTYTISRAGINAKSGGTEQFAKFNVTYKDVLMDNGTGFDDPQLGDQRIEAVNRAFEYVASIINDNGTADIQIDPSFFQNISMGSTPPLAISTPVFSGGAGFKDCHAMRHITTGSDPYSSLPDGFLQFNFGSNIQHNLNPDASPSSSQFDLYTIAVHEILHVLGFTSYVGQDGNSVAAPNTFTRFDECILGPDHQPLYIFNDESGTMNTPPASHVTSNELYFNNYNGDETPVYAPANYNASSLDHFDNSRASTQGYVMHPSISKGDAYKYIHPHEAYALIKLGYDINVSVATSVHENYGFDEFVADIYPNPAKLNEKVFLNLENVQEEEILVIVYDMMGRQAYSKVILTNQSGPLTAIDPHNNLAPGMYIVVGSSNDELFNHKLIIK